MTDQKLETVVSWRVLEDVIALTAGLGAGAGMMYLWDPQRGRSRRKRMIDEASGLYHRNEITLKKRGVDLLNRVRGLLSEMAAAAAEETVSDDILVDRVRSRLGHILAHPHEVEVRVLKGVVSLECTLPHSDRRRLKEEIEAIPGVKAVYDCSGRRHVVRTAAAAFD